MNVWEELDKICKLEEQSKFQRKNNNTHYNKHIVNKDGKDGENFDFTTKESYAESVKLLSESPSTYMQRVNNSNTIIGYISQQNRKIKNYYQIIVYIGDAITGTIITYYTVSWGQLIKQANPFLSGNKNYKYKFDLDGKFEGLNIFSPPNSMPEDKYHEIRNKIMKKRSLTRYEF